MDKLLLDSAFNSKREFFDSGATRQYSYRIEQLKKLKAAIEQHEQEILDALYADMHKPAFEAFTSEVGVMYEEINYAIKHLKKWMKPKRVSTPLVLHPSRSKIVAEPLGVVLIIGPWNYPFQLLLAPLVGAIAAGNCAVIKPSDNTPNTARVVEKIVTTTFDNRLVSVVLGPGSEVGPMLIERYRFDHIFFTGSPNVGKQIMSMASQHLTPVTLELGGKSPAIIHSDADLDVAVKRLVWAKFFNAGQTCVAPDYLLVHKHVKSRVVELAKRYIVEFYGKTPATSESLTHIVNQRRFNALLQYLSNGTVIHGGGSDAEKRFIEPTLLDNVSLDSSVMREEIFGPILPIVEYSHIEEVVPIIRRNRYPLALYLFTKSHKVERFIIERVEFGGGAINNALMHLVNPKLPFGGVGFSGMGSYHGRKSFEAMSHFKSILKTSTRVDPPLRYAPYTERKLSLARLFFR